MTSWTITDISTKQPYWQRPCTYGLHHIYLSSHQLLYSTFHSSFLKNTLTEFISYLICPLSNHTLPVRSFSFPFTPCQSLQKPSSFSDFLWPPSRIRQEFRLLQRCPAMRSCCSRNLSKTVSQAMGQELHVFLNQPLRTKYLHLRWRAILPHRPQFALITLFHLLILFRLLTSHMIVHLLTTMNPQAGQTLSLRMQPMRRCAPQERPRHCPLPQVDFTSSPLSVEMGSYRVMSLKSTV